MTIIMSDNRLGKRSAGEKLAPTPSQVSSLVEMYNQGKKADAKALARTLIAQFPNHGLGYKVLGAILHSNGQLAESMAVKIQAANLLPNDVGVLSNLGSLLCDLGNFHEAEGYLRRALAIRTDAFAHYLLGNALYAQNRFADAEACYRCALDTAPAYAEAHNNLSALLYAQGRVDDALASCRRALELKPDYADAWSNLGTALVEKGDLNQAVFAYQAAVRCKPLMADTEKKLGDVFRFMGEAEMSRAAYRQALALAPATVGMHAAIWLAISYYLANDDAQFQKMLDVSRPMMAVTDPHCKVYRTYRLYLELLRPWQIRRQQNQLRQTELEVFHVIGESHALSAHGAVVHYRDHKLRCASHWIEGCKQWHLGNDHVNKYKHQFEIIMEQLPRRSTILLLVGEIDCRLNEGIIKAWKKSSGKSLVEVATTTAGAYVRYVAKMNARYDHRMVVGGVPAPNVGWDALSGDTVSQLVYLIRSFNEALKEYALSAGLDFLDVYALTGRGDGIADGRWHIDNHHLLPSAIEAAFSTHCIQNDDL